MNTKPGSKNRKVQIQNLKNKLSIIRHDLEEKFPVPKELYNMTPFFNVQERFNHMTIDSLDKIEDILSSFENSCDQNEY